MNPVLTVAIPECAMCGIICDIKVLDNPLCRHCLPLLIVVMEAECLEVAV